MKALLKNAFSKKILVAIGFSILIHSFVTASIASDRFLNNDDGTVTDVKTGLMWAANDNGIPINWPDAFSYCQNYSGGGHTDWRMPTVAELASLYDSKHENKRGYHVTKLIDTSAQSLWALETRGYDAARFNFTYGQEYWLRQHYSGPTRALPVRRGD
jgi:hypothetical protein